MNRIVLALLALLAGLVTQAGPSHARIAASGGAEVMAQVPGAAQRAEVAQQAVNRPAGVTPNSDFVEIGRFDQQSPVIVGVIVGVDRAHE